MKRPNNIFAALTAVVVIGLMSIAPILNSCTGCSSCDGTKCKNALGFNEKTSVRDSLFRERYPLKAYKINVYIESSASMDGYVNGNTKFKTTIHRLIGQIVADVLIDDKSLSLNYINDTILQQSGALKQYTKNLSPASFSNAGGDRANSDIIEVISNVVTRTNKGEVSMFVSDCVYSPESSDDIDKALKKQQTDMLNILKNKAKSDTTFGVLVYRLTSDFHGIYYNKTNEHIPCNGDRPYFIWFFGNESILANVQESVSKIMTEEKANYVVGIPGYKYVPYKTIKSDHSYHYLSAKAGADSLFRFSFYADLSRIPLGNSYITNKSNYKFGKDKYYIKKVEPVNSVGSRNDDYNYKYTICIRGGNNSMITPTMIEVSMKSMLESLPEWVSEYDDPKGDDYNNGYDPTKLRTFGLKSLIEGIVDFYKEPSYITYKILIN